MASQQTGEVFVDCGLAPYDFDKKNETNFFVRTVTARVSSGFIGEKISARTGRGWGKSRRQVDNHGVNRAAVIKAYDVLVKSPEDRKKLEISTPLLVGARDKAIVELKREKLAAELNERNLSEEHERNHDLSLEEVHRAYDRVRGRQLGSAVFISDLATELQIGVPKLHEWIDREVIKSGRGSLDEGHWPTATDSQRAAAVEHLGSRRLLIRFRQPDRAAIVKEYDGQSRHRKTGIGNKTPAAIAKSTARTPLSYTTNLSKARKTAWRLRKELPALVAARDKALTAAKREQLQKEIFQIPGHAAKVRR